MSAEHYIDHNARLIITSWEGDAYDADFIEALNNYPENIQTKPDYANYNEIVDLSEIGSIQLTIDGLKTIGKIASKTDQDEANRKLALIVHSIAAYSFAVMYEKFRRYKRKTNKEVCVFKNKSDALKWIQTTSSPTENGYENVIGSG